MLCSNPDDRLQDWTVWTGEGVSVHALTLFRNLFRRGGRGSNDCAAQRMKPQVFLSVETTVTITVLSM